MTDHDAPINLGRCFNRAMDGLGYMVQGRVDDGRLAAISRSDTCAELLAPDPKFFYLIHRTNKSDAEQMPQAGIAAVQDPKVLLSSWSPLFCVATEGDPHFWGRVSALNAEILALRHRECDTVSVVKIPTPGPMPIEDRTARQLENQDFVDYALGGVFLTGLKEPLAGVSELIQKHEYKDVYGRDERAYYLPASFAYGTLDLGSGEFAKNPEYDLPEAAKRLPKRSIDPTGRFVSTIRYWEEPPIPEPLIQPAAPSSPSPAAPWWRRLGRRSDGRGPRPGV